MAPPRPCQFDGRTSEIERNLLALYRQATADDIAAGVGWYPRTHSLMRQWADIYGHSIATVACITAALSPQCEWSRNLAAAHQVLNRSALSGGVLRSCLRKAERIRDERAGDTLAYFPSGPKVHAFARNLAGDWAAVTVDTHAMQAALGDVQANYALPWRPYGVFVGCYRRAACRVAVEPAIFQAIIWHVWKRLYPTARKQQLRRQWDVIGEF